MLSRVALRLVSNAANIDGIGQEVVKLPAAKGSYGRWGLSETFPRAQIVLRSFGFDDAQVAVFGIEGKEVLSKELA